MGVIAGYVHADCRNAGISHAHDSLIVKFDDVVFHHRKILARNPRIRKGRVCNLRPVAIPHLGLDGKRRNAECHRLVFSRDAITPHPLVEMLGLVLHDIVRVFRIAGRHLVLAGADMGEFVRRDKRPTVDFDLRLSIGGSLRVKAGDAHAPGAHGAGLVVRDIEVDELALDIGKCTNDRHDDFGAFRRLVANGCDHEGGGTGEDGKRYPAARYGSIFCSLGNAHLDAVVPCVLGRTAKRIAIIVVVGDNRLAIGVAPHKRIVDGLSVIHEPLGHVDEEERLWLVEDGERGACLCGAVMRAAGRGSHHAVASNIDRGRIELVAKRAVVLLLVVGELDFLSLIDRLAVLGFERRGHRCRLAVVFLVRHIDGQRDRALADEEQACVARGNPVKCRRRGDQVHAGLGRTGLTWRVRERQVSPGSCLHFGIVGGLAVVHLVQIADDLHLHVGIWQRHLERCGSIRNEVVPVCETGFHRVNPRRDSIERASGPENAIRFLDRGFGSFLA